MDRIGPAGGSPTVALTNGQQGFVDEDLASGQEGTEVVAAFMNAVQEELMSVLAAAGITPNIGNFGQVLAAILILAANALNATFNASGFGSFILPVPGGTPLQFFFGPVSSPVGEALYSQLLPGTFNNGFKGGVIADGGGYAYGYGVGAETDNSHIAIFCPTTQIEGGGLNPRSLPGGGYFLVWGT